MRLLLLLCLLSMPITYAQTITYERLEAAGKVYEKVRVKEVTPHSLIIFHKGGLAQIPLSQLTPELQEQFGYDSKEAEAYKKDIDAAARELESQAIQQSKVRNRVQKTNEPSRLSSLINAFGKPAELQEGIDMRREMFDYNLSADDQGRRPSCSIFAVMSALELTNARSKDTPEPLSEEYLIWATRETLGQNSKEIEADEDEDLGFALEEVFQALAAYGVPLEEQMPNTFGKSMSKIEAPDADIIEQAKLRQNIRVFIVPGRTQEDKLENILHALNAQVPVIIGVAWPFAANNRSHVLSGQKTDGYHAVTLFGYKNETGNRDDVRFIFRNSWGPRWGVGGYGFITWDYMLNNLRSVYILEVSD